MNTSPSAIDKTTIPPSSETSQEEKNKELEEFAYIVSHDLNAPLRHTREFAKLLIDKLGDKVSEEERKYVDYMEKGIHKTEAMLEGLLRYSRLNTKAQDFTDVDCNEIMENIKMLQAETIEQTGAQIQYSTLPTLNGDKEQLEQLFYHLINNAIKFNTNTPPVIDIDVREEGNSWYFTIKDNGVGIPKEHCKPVFSIFKRLHTDEEYPGVGIGLALARKIVARHHGTIRIEPQNEGGAAVHFNLEK